MNAAPRPVLVAAAAVLGLLVLCLLGQDNLGSNEAGKLALALQQVRPDWNPGDWYLNTPQHYQWLFQQFAGHLLQTLGISWGSLAVRLAGYGIWAWATAQLFLALGVSPGLGLGAIALFLLDQSLIAREWMVGSGEPKTFAYASLILAFLAWTRRSPGLLGWWSGLACSFHVLVGGYGSLALAAATWIRQSDWSRSEWWRVLIGSGVGLAPLLTVLLRGKLAQSSVPMAGLPDEISATWIYTYLRNPHHLDPDSWSGTDWGSASLWLTLFCVAALLTRRDRTHQGRTRQQLALWTTLTLIPFGVGLCISLWDQQGILLRFYPFRVADSLVPLTTILLLSGEIQSRFKRVGSPLGISLALIISIQQCSGWLPSWGERWSTGFQPDPDKQVLYSWIRSNSTAGAKILSPPAGFEDLALLTGRAIIGQFKQVPNRSSDVSDWFVRMQDLGGDKQFWRRSRGLQTRKDLSLGYRQLTPDNLKQLSKRYSADIIITGSNQEGPAGWNLRLQTPSWDAWSPIPSTQPTSPSMGRADQRDARPKPTSS
jgi:hypothetical protein